MNKTKVKVNKILDLCLNSKYQEAQKALKSKARVVCFYNLSLFLMLVFLELLSLGANLSYKVNTEFLYFNTILFSLFGMAVLLQKVIYDIKINTWFTLIGSTAIITAGLFLFTASHYYCALLVPIIVFLSTSLLGKKTGLGFLSYFSIAFLLSSLNTSTSVGVEENYLFLTFCFFTVYLISMTFIGTVLLLQNSIESEKEVLALKQKQKELEGLMITSSKMSSLGEMASSIAHEINNPLLIISGRNEMLRWNIENKNFEVEKLVNLLINQQSAVDRISKIIKSLRRFSRDGSDDPYEKISVKKIIDNTISFCLQKIRNSEIDLHIEPIDSEVKIECQEVQLSQVLLNLINNAVDALSEQNDPKIIIKVDANEQDISITCSDNGSGIPEKVLSKIFKPFYTTKPIGKGTGLGLSLSKEIIETHNGSFSVNIIDGFTCFKMTLPKSQNTPLSDQAA